MHELIDELVRAVEWAAVAYERGHGRAPERAVRDAKAALLARCEQLEADNEKLLRFAGSAFRHVRGLSIGCDWDGGDVQEAFLDSGLLESRPVVQPCGDVCACADLGEFPGECMFATDLGRRAQLAASSSAKSAVEGLSDNGGAT